MNEVGLAIDLGSSKVALSVFDIQKRQRVAYAVFPNPQVPFGEDIISRAKYEATRSSSNVSLTSLIRESLSEESDQLLTRNNLDSADVSEVVVVGNAVMQHLLLGRSMKPFLQEPYTLEEKDAIELPASSVGFPLQNATLYTPPLVESFIGSDALAVILGSGMANDVYPSMAIDIGTNSEIIVQHSNRFWIGSAASGPAFEGMSLNCGMPVDEGAIVGVSIELPSRNLSYTTIGDAAPRGICGVGAISALHAFRRLNLIDQNGSINRHLDSKYIKNDGELYWIQLADPAVSSNQQSVYIDQMDIRMLQQSKTSIRTVIGLLMREGNVDASELKSVLITGAFGAGLDIPSAQAINMIPTFPNLSSVYQKADIALIGAELFLWRKSLRQEVRKILSSITYVDMMSNSLYHEEHARNLFF